MQLLKVVSEDSLAHSKAFVFVLEEYLALVKAGHADYDLPFTNGSLVAYALLGDQVIGASVWSYDPPKRAAWVLFSAVAEEHRKQGIYKQLIHFVEQQAIRKGAAALYSGVHVTNDAMIAAAQASGRTLGWYRTKKPLSAK
jgi:GNAT superfamily N-acetyltransferase